MATKEAVAGGVLLAGGGAGGGYAAYKYINVEEPEKASVTAEQPDVKTKQKIEDYLNSNTTSEGTGKPISKESDSSWWNKAYHKYFLEISENTDELDNVGGKSKRDAGTPDKSEDFKTACNTLLGKEKENLNDEDEDVKKAKKWCVTYKTAKDKDHSTKTLEGEDHESWKTKYEESEKDSTLKAVVEPLKGFFSTETNDENKKKKAVHKWCTMALDASESYSLKSKISTICSFKTG